jgi:secreted protein with Ig-like and vWFA domain
MLVDSSNAKQSRAEQKQCELGVSTWLATERPVQQAKQQPRPKTENGKKDEKRKSRETNEWMKKEIPRK